MVAKTAQQHDNGSVSSENTHSTASPPNSPKPSPSTAKPAKNSIVSNRLNDAVLAKIATASDAKRSPELIALNKEYELMRDKLRKLVASTKKYHATMAAVDTDRVQMARDMDAMAHGSPIAGEANKALTVFLDSFTDSAQARNSYQTQIVDYCAEWESVANTRVVEGQAAVKKARASYLHYQKKVEDMREQIQATEAKGKSPSASITEKLTRNEEKLSQASTDFENTARPLCYLLEEVNAAWKDLLKMLQSAMQWELQTAEAKVSRFSQWQPDAMNAAAEKCEANPGSDAS